MADEIQHLAKEALPVDEALGKRGNLLYLGLWPLVDSPLVDGPTVV